MVPNTRQKERISKTYSEPEKWKPRTKRPQKREAIIEFTLRNKIKTVAQTLVLEPPREYIDIEVLS